MYSRFLHFNKKIRRNLKDQRYKAIKSLIQSNSLQGLKEIFTVIPLSVVQQDLNMNYVTFRRRIDKPEFLTMRDVAAMAELFEVDSAELFKLVVADMDRGKKKRK